MSKRIYESLLRPGLHAPRWWRDILDRLLLIIAIYTLINLATIRFVVDGPSMEPTFTTGQFLVVSRLNYLLADPRRGDLAVFHFPGNTERDYIKRVIGLPGDTIEIRDTLVYVNGQALTEPYVKEPCAPYSCPDSIWQLDQNEYFLMGDNRNYSSDSRAFGAVQRDFLLGEVIFRYWTPDKLGVIQPAHYSD